MSRQTPLPTPSEEPLVCFRCGVFAAEQTLECPRWCWHCSERTRRAVQCRLQTMEDLRALYAPLIEDYRWKRLPAQWSFRGEGVAVALTLRALLGKGEVHEAEWEAILRDVYYVNEWWHYTRLGEG